MKGHSLLISILVAMDQRVDFEPSSCRTVAFPSAWCLIMIQGMDGLNSLNKLQKYHADLSSLLCFQYPKTYLQRMYSQFHNSLYSPVKCFDGHLNWTYDCEVFFFSLRDFCSLINTDF